MKRAKHNLSNYRLHTAQMGELFPIGCMPVLPGDTVQQHTSMLVRASPLNTPVMHPVSVRIHHFFCPNRIVWDEWEDFITGGPDGNNQSVIPTITNLGPKSVLSYLGVPFIEGGTNDNPVTALALRAFNKIYNEYYRDQDLVAERAEDDLTLPLCAWEKDYFTTARPFTQKGTDVTVPVLGNANVVGDGTSPQWVGLAGAQQLGDTQVNPNAGDAKAIDTEIEANTDQSIRFNTQNTGLTVDLSTAQGVAINDFREAFAVQRYQEARARYGSRFTEYLRYLGINPSDARLQRPEYLGGGVQRLQFSEVLQTAPDDTAGPTENGVGDLYGHGIAGVKTPRFRKFFEEHGYVITLCSIRPKSIYWNSCPKEFLKATKEDFYQKELIHLGQQEVSNQEINLDDTDETFGYQDRYDEYRSHPSQVGQDFKTTLSSWTLGRDIPPGGALNQTFVECDPSTRIFQVEEGDTMWCMANHKVVARRLLPKKVMPRII